MSPPEGSLSLRQALLLGALHGPAELLPISSSGHLVLVPWLLGWDYSALDSELRKSFEVVLHAGTAAALLLTLRDEVEEAARGFDARRAQLIVLSFLPPAVIGIALERPIERRLGTPASVAAGLIAGAAVMAVADRRPQRRHHQDAGAVDAWWFGIAQACALLPGVSRNGATVAAARLREFTREDSNRLSRHVALPVIAGAAALKTVRLARRGLPWRAHAPFALGVAAAFASTLASTWLIDEVERDRSLLRYAVYRVALAGAVLARLRSWPSSGSRTIAR